MTAIIHFIRKSSFSYLVRFILFLLLIIVSSGFAFSDVFADHEQFLNIVEPNGISNVCNPNNLDCTSFPISVGEQIVFDLHTIGVYNPLDTIKVWLDKDDFNQNTEIFAEFGNGGGTSSPFSVIKNGEGNYHVVIDTTNIAERTHSIKIDGIQTRNGPTRTFSGGDGYQLTITDPNNTEPTITSFFTDKTSYISGETIVISGHIENHFSNYDAIYHINAPNGPTVLQNSATIDSNGDFTASITADPEIFVACVIPSENLYDDCETYPLEGTYDINVIHVAGSITASTSFEFTIPQLTPQDGDFVLPCSMQETGDGVSAGSCQGIYSNEKARAEIGISYNSGLFPIKDYVATGYFIDENGVQGSNISVTHGMINPGESTTLVFENSITGFVSEFKMQMFGGDLVVDEPDTIPPIVVVPNNMAIQVTSNNPSPVTFSITATDDIDGILTPTCSNTSGSNFPIGVTIVTCTATDAAGNSNSKSFTITVIYDEPTSEPEQDDEITVKTSKSSYDPGDILTIHVTGVSQTVNIEIRSAEGSMIERLSFPASSLGEINQPWTIPEELASGKYVVKVSDAFNSAQTQFLIESPEPETPEIMSFVDPSTYLGGTKSDWSVDSAIDGNGNVFVLGYTTSSDFPTTANAYELNFKGGKDVFISKFNSDLTILLSSTYLGGSGDDEPKGIAIDDSGNIFVSGITTSSDFPTISAYDDKLSGTKDAFVALFDNDLESLLVSTYLGGSGNEISAYPFVDNSGSLFITGSTDSNDFPITLSAFDQTFKSTEGFLTKFENDLLTLTSSTFIGGSGSDYIYDKGTTDNFGHVYLVGKTQSSDFSTTTNAYSNYCKDNFFISKISNDLSSLVASTCIGSSNIETDPSIILDNSDDVIITGLSYGNFPTTSGVFMNNNPGGSASIVISKFNNELSSLKSSTFIGGNSLDNSPEVHVDSSNNIIISGFTTSNNYPTTTDAFDQTYNGNGGDDDGIFSIFDTSLSALLYSTYVGGSSGDFIHSSNLYDNDLYLAGTTYSLNFPQITEGYQSQFNGDRDAFVFKFSLDSISEYESPAEPTPESTPELEVPASFVDTSKDPQSYVDRYNNESSYKEWFDENYSKYDSIYQAVGLSEPTSQSDFELDIETRGMKVLNIEEDDDFVSLQFTVDITSSIGILDVTFPRTYFDSIFNGVDDDFIILADGDEPTFTETKTTSYSRTLSIELKSGTEEVEIIGSKLNGNISNDFPNQNDSLEFTVKSNYSSYSYGDNIVISGTIEDLSQDSTSIQIVVVSPDGNIVTIASANSDFNGYYSTTFKAGGTMTLSGDYEIRAQHGSSKITNTFYYSGNTSASIPDGDFKSQVTIIPVTGSSSATNDCVDVQYGCFEPGIAKVQLGGVVIFSNTDSAAHTFSAGTASDGPTGEFDTSMVMAGNSYEWTADVRGSIPYFCMVHPWMNGIILVGEGTAPPPTPEPEPNKHVDLKISIEHDVYDINTVAVLDISLEGNDSTQNVAIGIVDPRGTSVISRSVSVGPDDTVSFEFKIDENFKTGNYKIIATTSDGSRTEKDIEYFKIKSQFNSFKISHVDVTDQQGNLSNLEAGELGFIKVNLESNKLISTLVTVNIFDSELTSIGIGSVKTTLSSGNSEIILSFMIPDDAAVGLADIYVNAFSDWPSNGGIPLTNEFAITESIGNTPPNSIPEPKCGAGTVYDDVSNSCVLGENNPTPTPYPTPSSNCGAGTIFDETANACVLDGTQTSSNSIKVATDKSFYSTGENIVILGSIETLAEYSQSVTILIISPDNNIMSISQVIPSSNGSYSTNLKAGGTMVLSGIYEVRAQYGAQKVTSTFVFTSEGSTMPEPTPEPEPTPGGINDSITVAADRVSYSEGQTIIITGEVRDLYSGTKVSVIVKAPNGNLVSIAQVIVGTDKKFGTELTAGGALMKSEGAYIVTAQYGTVNRSAETTFEFEGATQSTDNNYYGTITDTTVSVQGTNELIEYTITGGQLLSIIPDRDTNSLIVSVDSPSSGILTLVIPRVILDATLHNGADEDFYVLVDGEEVAFTEMTSSTDRKLFVGLKAGDKEIEIVGTFVI